MSALAEAVLVVRLATMSVWAVIVWLSLPEIGLAIRGRATLVDWKRCVIGLVGVVIAPFQYSAAFVERIAATPGILIANAALFSAGLLALVVWSRRAPEGHRRAALFFHLGVAALGVAAGLCL